MSSRYGSGVVVVQAGGRQSAYHAPRSTTSPPTYSSSSYAPSYYSMDSSSSSRSAADSRYRSGSSVGYCTDVKEVSNVRTGQNVVIVHHGRSNTDMNEPRSSDYAWGTSGSK